jgi:hypothetical protein
MHALILRVALLVLVVALFGLLLSVTETDSAPVASVPARGSSSGASGPSQETLERNLFLAQVLGGPWICTNVERGSAPFMKGSRFQFGNGSLVVYGGGARAEHQWTLEGVIRNLPAGSRFSAILRMGSRREGLTAIDDGLMVISWGNDAAKLRLQR